MCGRYALHLRPAQIRQLLASDGMPSCDAPPDEGDQAPRQSYNFAPGYHGVVYRADTPDWGAGPHRARRNDAGEEGEPREATGLSTAAGTSDGQKQADGTRYKLQSMKWGLVPFWTKRNPDYASVLRTINCRDDSLAMTGGMWSTMKARKRCIVVAEGFYEWLKSGKHKTPHYIKRKDGRLMCMAGLWDCVQYEDNDAKNYTYTVITTGSNEQLRFLHDRMPVILEAGSEDMKTWLDPGRHEWSAELQALLKPWDGELEVYPVSQEVGKVGNNSPSFVVPVASKENKSNIANFFANAANKSSKASLSSPPKKPVGDGASLRPQSEQEPMSPVRSNQASEVYDDVKAGTKRGPPDPLDERPGSAKKVALTPSPKKSPSRKISAVSNTPKTGKAKSDGSQKITKFFSLNSA